MTDLEKVEPGPPCVQRQPKATVRRAAPDIGKVALRSRSSTRSVADGRAVSSAAMGNAADLIQAALRDRKARPLRRTLFNLADAHNQAAELSFNKIDSTGNAGFAAPAIVCRSFALELLLKFFIVIQFPDATQRFDDLRTQHVDLNGHRYSELFDRLRDEQRDRGSVLGACGAGHNGRACPGTADRDQRTPFIDWRYIYESRGERCVNPLLLDDLVIAFGLAAQSEVRRLTQQTETFQRAPLSPNTSS